MVTKIPITFFAPAKREPIEVVQRQAGRLSQVPLITYNTVLATADGGLRDPATTPAVAALIPGGTVQCSSCHTTHDPTNVPFLRVSNAASALCLTCHIK